MSPLALLKEGEKAEIIEESLMRRDGHRHRHGCGYTANGDGSHNRRHEGGHGHDHLMDMGLRPGKCIRMVANSGSGPLVLMVDECRIALGRGAAMKIYVQRIEE
jgi:Fe2+ transport system protein FeoA